MNSSFLEPSRKFQAAIKYSLGILCEECGDLNKHIYYSSKELDCIHPHIRIVPSHFFSEEVYGTPQSMPDLPLQSLQGVPILFGRTILQKTNDKIIIHADLVASAYFLLTRYEEIIRRDIRDEHGRFPGKESLPYRAGFIARPIVNEYQQLIRKLLGELHIRIPESKGKFTVCMTHDMDAIRFSDSLVNQCKILISCFFGIRPFKNVFRVIASLLRIIKDPFEGALEYFFKMDNLLTQRFGSIPIYFFIACRSLSYGCSYSITSINLIKVARKIQSTGAQIGLHTSYCAGINPKLIAEEKESLEKCLNVQIKSNRFHFLSFRDISDTWKLVDAGITDDYSLGYADIAGFRLGICTPIGLFDPILLKKIPLTEHPLIAMDGTIVQKNYMSFSEQQALKYCINLIDQTAMHKGEFIMLWHNSTVAEISKPCYRNLYAKLINYSISLPRS